MRKTALTVACVLLVAWTTAAQELPAMGIQASQLDGIRSLQDFRAMREMVPAASQDISQDISARTFSRAVNEAIPGIETSLSSKEALDRSAFSAGVDRVAIAETDNFGPQHLTRQEAINIEQVGKAFLETASSTAKRLNVPTERISSQFSSARIALPDFDVLPPRLACPFQRSSWPTCDRLSMYRTLDGSCNNLNFPLWGKSFTPFERIITPDYEDGISSPRARSVAGGQLPNARKISREFHLALTNQYRELSHLAMEFGQFVSHDIQFNALSKGYRGSNLNCCERPNRDGCFPILIPPGDPFFTNRTCLNFVRALPTPNLECTLGQREQLNQNSHFIDASQVYGSDKSTSDSLRTFSAGLLKTSDDLLPTESGANAGCTITVQSRPCFRAGDPRVNQQPALVSIHTMWMREHNRIARRLAQIQPTWQDEKLFQEARRLVVAMIQHITYGEYLPEILDDGTMSKYGLKPLTNRYNRGYSEVEKPMIRNGFSTAAFRFGHSMISDHLLTHNGFSQTSNQLLKETFLKPDLVYTRGVDELARGLTRSSAETVDRYITSQVTRHLFERQPGQGGDLAATNIQRGRDHGLPDYQKWRRHCGLPGQYSHEYSIRRALKQVYRSPNDMDLFTAGVSEIKVPGGKVGPTFACLIGEQFKSLKNGDRFYYENDQVGKFTLGQLDEIRQTTMSKVICRNTGISKMQENAFRIVMLGNQLVNCRSMPDVDFTKWGQCQSTGGGWSSWSTTPCFGNWKLRYRLCTSSGQNQCGNTCSGRYEVQVESCGWIWEPLWPRTGGYLPDLSARSSANSAAQTNDIKSRVEAQLTSLIGNTKGNIDASVFEKAMSSVSVPHARA